MSPFFQKPPILISALLLCVFLIAAPASAGAKCESERSTAATVTCLKAQHQKQKDSLNAAFAQALADIETDAADQIKAGQSAWITYRDLQCESHAEAEDHESLKRVENLRCLSNLTQNRIEALSVLDADDDQTDSKMGVMPRWMTVLSQDKPNAYWDYDGRIEFDWACADGLQTKTEIHYAMIGIEPLSDGSERIVLGLSDSPKTGKPRVTIYDIAVQSCEEDTRSTHDEPYICSPTPDLNLRIGENREGCRHAIVLNDKKAITVIISKDEKELVLSVNDSRPKLPELLDAPEADVADE
jgi:uncharacterized protein YecT (DUF1311 family)